MYRDLWLQYTKVRKIYKGGNYSRAETIRGNTVFVSKEKADICQIHKSMIVIQSLTCIFVMRAYTDQNGKYTMVEINRNLLMFATLQQRGSLTTSRL